MPKFKSLEDERNHLKIVLAVACRVFAQNGYTDGIGGYIAVRDPEFTDTYWLNPMGVDFSMVTVSSLIRVNSTGDVIEGSYPASRPAWATFTRFPSEGSKGKSHGKGKDLGKSPPLASTKGKGKGKGKGKPVLGTVGFRIGDLVQFNLRFDALLGCPSIPMAGLVRARDIYSTRTERQLNKQQLEKVSFLDLLATVFPGSTVQVAQLIQNLRAVSQVLSTPLPANLLEDGQPTDLQELLKHLHLLFHLGVEPAPVQLFNVRKLQANFVPVEWATLLELPDATLSLYRSVHPSAWLPAVDITLRPAFRTIWKFIQALMLQR
jgi:hypothetical protein